MDGSDHGKTSRLGFLVGGLILALFLHFVFLRGGEPDYEELLRDVEAPESLKKHTEEFNKPRVITVTAGVHLAIGYALANSILLEAPDGAIIVDVTESVQSGQAVLQDFRKITDKPIKAIIYTHNHVDHTYGAKAFIEDPSNPPDIWSHHTTPEQFRRVASVSVLTFRRAMRQFGVLLPHHVNSGIGPLLRVGYNISTGLVQPNKFVYEEEETVTIAGMKITFLHIPGETSDQIGVWLPEKKALLCADDFYRAFPNLYAIRGTPPRGLRHWVRSLDRMRRLRPEYLVPSHTMPHSGEDKVYGLLTNYRDAIQLVHDQTVRFMNKGLLPDEIAPKVKLPPKLLEDPFLQEFYGTVPWSVKGVFSNYVGWFSGDPVDLWPLTPEEKARRMVALAGGVKRTIIAAETALAAGDTQWALELASHVMRIRPTHEGAKKIRLETFKKLASQQTSANGRNYYLTLALEDAGLINKPGLANVRNNVRNWPLLHVFEALTLRFKAEECQDVETTVLFDMEDVQKTIGFHIRNSIVELFTDPPSDVDVTVHVTSATWLQIVGREINPVRAYLDGRLSVDGGILAFRNVMNCFDQEI